ncbi:TPA: hypothetical protein ACH3X2_004792 [Trebouxia sp. C0005]
MPSKETDQKRLLELGIRSRLQRPLHWRQNCCICFCVMSPLTGISGLYGIGLVYGGPVVLVWGWVLASILTTCVSLALSELSSAFPVSGGLYFWAFMLGRQTGPFASWCVGWTNFLGQIALVAADTFSCVQLFLSFLYLVSLDSSGSGYYPSNALQLYLFGGLLLIFAIINVQPLSVVGRLSELGALFNLLGTIVFVAVLLLVTKKQQHFSWVLTHYEVDLRAFVPQS